MGLKDDYMQWFPLKVTSGAASNTLTEAEHNTPMGADTKIAFRIHKAEWHLGVSLSGQDNEQLTVTASTRKGLSSMPAINDYGTIDQFILCETEGAAGYAVHNWPQNHSWMPPFIIAAENISMYVQSSTDKANYQSKDMRCRLGYTMVDLTGEQAWREVYQTWARSA